MTNGDDESKSEIDIVELLHISAEAARAVETATAHCSEAVAEHLRRRINEAISSVLRDVTEGMRDGKVPKKMKLELPLPLPRAPAKAAVQDDENGDVQAAEPENVLPIGRAARQARARTALATMPAYEERSYYLTQAEAQEFRKRRGVKRSDDIMEKLEAHLVHYIRHRPGLRAVDAAPEFRLSAGELRQAYRNLLDKGLIVSTGDGHGKKYYPAAVQQQPAVPQIGVRVVHDGQPKAAPRLPSSQRKKPEGE